VHGFRATVRSRPGKPEVAFDDVGLEAFSASFMLLTLTIELFSIFSALLNKLS